MQLDFLFPDIRSNQTDPYKFQVYRFKRVMFGVNVSPFLLSATIKHHIENYREQYPAATEMLDTCLYVDDVISGADDISQALKVSKDAETIMKNASMKLRKWNSNDQTLMRTWEREGLETHPRHPDDSSKIPSSKVLGIPWDVVHDYFTIDVKGLLQLDTSKPITKELCFNQLGKYTIQLGSCHPTRLGSNAYYKNFGYGSYPGMTSYRQIFMHGDSSEVQIHTFSDASQKAYGAAAFLRVKHKDRVSVDLVTSKSRVAPLKRLSLPRLELMGALLAARLAKEVKKILDQKCSTRALFWTDSQVTLHWIKGPSHRWKPFVANRVREIQSLTDPNSWFHCSGKDNPADLLTRGISVDALTTNSKWWNGSSFLRQIDFQTKGLDEAIPERVYLTEMRKNSNPKEDISLTLTVTKNNFLENIIDISNNYVKLIRVVSFLYRFIHNCRTRITKIKGPLTSQEVSHAENWLIHSLHEREFYEEMRKLLAGEPIPMKSKLTPLNVFLDESNIIRSYRPHPVSDQPVRTKPYRMSHRQNEILKNEINRMLKLGIIEVGESDYMSPMILVEVAGKEPRPCIDYRKLNGIIRTEYFPLPNIEERVEKVSAAKFITVLDLSKRYWQIPLSKTAQRYASFCTNFDTWESHIKHMETVLQRIKRAKLTIKPSKCKFAQQNVKFLGHIVGQGFRTPSEIKVQAVLEFPTPRTKTQIRTFLGIAGYYQKYINLFSVIAAPLTDALKGRAKKGEIKWTTECENAFRELKGKLIDKPVLYAPNFEREFIVQTDASNAGMGAVLTQITEQGEEHPILYLIMTDHNPLVWLNRNVSSNPRLMRWALALQPYNFKIVHRIRYRYSFKRYSPYFFKNDEGHNVTVNGDRYRALITNFFIPELNNHDVQELRFQQDGATCHTARATIDLLKDTFGDCLISRFGPVNWPPRSCDLTPLDYFLWGYVKSLVYADKPQTLDHLEDNIRRVIADIRPQMLEKVIENWTSRLDYIQASRGCPMPEIVFKM
ncbi:retrovirus-related Pol polyprotein from transposon 297 [Trichonephila clavipes]|nr:retrovirus-related Pol polyprotein from transposon 297 [Trichonephila clavipes]